MRAGFGTSRLIGVVESIDLESGGWAWIERGFSPSSHQASNQGKSSLCKRSSFVDASQGSLAAVLVKTRTRFLGPLVAISGYKRTNRSINASKVEAALRSVDNTLRGLCLSLGLCATG